MALISIQHSPFNIALHRRAKSLNNAKPINIIKSAADLEALKKQRSLRCHELKGDREGQWAINVTDRYRLIFSLQGDDLEIVQIEEVSKHYGD